MKYSFSSCFNMLSGKHLTIINGLDINLSSGLFYEIYIRLCPKSFLQVFDNWVPWEYPIIKWNFVTMDVMTYFYHLIMLFIIYI